MSLNADTLATGNYCLNHVSKNIDGQALVLDADTQPCGNPPCDSLTLVQQLRLTVRAGPCDDKIGGVLDGFLFFKDLTTVFAGKSENLRGVHAAQFRWTTMGGVRFFGTAEGITNAGTARGPVFPRCQDCESCGEVGVLTGHLFAVGSNVPGIPVPNFNVEAIYRLAWNPNGKIGSTDPVTGTLEGVIIMPCP